MISLTEVLQFVQLVALLFLGWFARRLDLSLSAYAEEKGKNQATKEDVEEITRKIESIKASVEQSQLVERRRYELKYEACLDALDALDAHISHKLANIPYPIIAQKLGTEKLRQIHNRLVLTVDNPAIVTLFLDMQISLPEEESRPVTDMLNDLRNLIRSELGFGKEIQLSRDIAWFGAANSDPLFEKAKSEAIERAKP